MKISEDEVMRVARLAHLNVDGCVDKLATDMNRIIEFADLLSEVDTSGIEPTDHALNMKNVFREDVVEASYDRDDILKNAPGQEDGYFVLPVAIE